MRDVLVYAGKAFSDFNVFFDGSKSFDTPKKDYDIISIPGRNGDLSIFNDRFQDVEITFPCFIRTNFTENFRALTDFLNSVDGYQRLETTKEPNHFRKALFVGAVIPTTGTFLKSGKFDITFRCNPQRWLKSGEEWLHFESTVTQSETILPINVNILNPTNMKARPLIKLTVRTADLSNTASVSIDGQPVVFNTQWGEYDTIIVDSDIRDVYGEDGSNLNGIYLGSFPFLKAGNNNIQSGLGCDVELDIQPRWYVI